MNQNKIFGMCIVLLLAAVSVHAAYNETLLDALLATYDTSYDNGGFTAVLSNVSCRGSSVWNASILSETTGDVTFDFLIGGPNSNDSYSAVLLFEKSWNTDIYTPLFGEYYDANLAISKEESAPGHKLFTFDGTYFPEWFEPTTHYIELKIFQNYVLAYQKKFESLIEASCDTEFAYIVTGSGTSSRGIDTNADGKFELLNITLNIGLPEPRYNYSIPQPKDYTVGIYVWDNASNAAYTEKTVNTNGIAYNDGSHTATFTFNSTQFKNFKLNNTPILLKSFVVDGIIVEEAGVKLFNKLHPSPKFKSSNFTVNSANIVDVYFDISDQTDGKINELGLTLNVSGINNPPYDAEVSLESIYGEIVEVQSFTVSSDYPSVYFDGTDIYESKINGPYRVGFARIMKGSNEEFYKTNIGLTAELSYSNFTAPPMADISVNDSDVIINGADVDVTIHNQGTGDATGVTISLFDDNAGKIDEIIVDSLLSSADYSHTFSGVNLGTAYVMVDFDNIVEELNESNNVAEALPNEISVAAYVYNQNENVYNTNKVAIAADVDFSGIIKNALADETPARINLTFNAEHDVTYSATGFQPLNTKFFFDKNMLSCIEGQTCSFINTYNTSCIWSSISWACTLSQDNVEKEYFRLYPNPMRIKINAYLAGS